MRKITLDQAESKFLQLLLEQGAKLVKSLNNSGAPYEQLQDLLDSNLLIDLLQANINQIDRNAFRQVIGLKPLLEQIEVVNVEKTTPKENITKQIETAIELLGEENVFGPKEVEKTWGVCLKEVPNIPFLVAELEQAGKMEQMLILRVSETADGKPMSLEAMNDIVQKRWQKAGKGGLLSTPDGWENFIKEAYKKASPRLGWALVSQKEVILESLSKNYIEQTEVIVSILKREAFKGMKLPDIFAEAIAEFESKKDQLTRLMVNDWQKATKELSKLKITQLTRQTTPEAIYDLAMYYDRHNKRLLNYTSTWTASLNPDGELVLLGYFGARGVCGDAWGPDLRDGSLGVSLSRRS